MKPTAPVEPLLALNDIQGIAIPGFAKPHQRLVGFRVPAAFAARFAHFLRHFAAEISPATDVLDDRRLFRQEHPVKNTAVSETRPPSTFVALGLSFVGLMKLRPSADQFVSPAFREGLAARSALLGDPTDPAAEGYAGNWLVGHPGAELDGLIVVAGDQRDDVDRKADSIAERLRADVGALIDYQENADRREDLPGHEMFGFDDGVSQPGPRGHASEAPGDFVTHRSIEPTETPETWLFGRPGQDLVWPGEFVFGYPGTSPDPLVPGAISEEGPAWTRNGSFLVFRRLRQDVGGFWNAMQNQAKAISAMPGFEGLDALQLAARVVGRWPSGAPVVRVPDGDVEALGKDKLANNAFKYAADSVALPIEGYEDPFPQAKADPVGITCPWAAHIRKVNTRDSGSDMGGRDSTYNRRIIRVGIPFGTPPTDPYAIEPTPIPMDRQRGLLFLSIQTSLEQQFEFLQARWMNDPSRPKMPGGHDQLIGQNAAPGENRVRTSTLFGKHLAQATVQITADHVIPTGGGYFFLPSISTVRDVLGASPTA